jgi:hypothetical protein
MKLLYLLSLVQGWYYLLTGIWPLVHYPSFEAVTGPKTDVWLVKTVGVLIIPIGLALIAGRKKPEFPIVLLATASAAGFAGIDIYYSLSGTIKWIYLLDAAAQIMLLIGWACAYTFYIKYGKKQI